MRCGVRTGVGGFDLYEFSRVRESCSCKECSDRVEWYDEPVFAGLTWLLDPFVLDDEASGTGGGGIVVSTLGACCACI